MKPSTSPRVTRHRDKLIASGGGPLYLLLPPESKRKLDALVSAAQTSRRAIVIELIRRADPTDYERPLPG